MKPEPLDRIRFDAATLIEAHPPQWRDPNKKVGALDSMGKSAESMLT
jgi:hypothetical protein